MPRTTLRCAALAAILIGQVPAVGAQPVACRAERTSDGSFKGACVQGDTTVGQLALRRGTGSAPHLWIGTIRGERFRSAASAGPAGETEVGVDTRPGGALRLGRAWLTLSDVRTDSASVAFLFQFDGEAPATDVDVEILARARSYLADASRWNRVDTTDMVAAPVKGFSCAPAPQQSMFCAVYLASLEVAGDYAHFRPAVNAVREAVSAVSKRSYRHPLIEFNNDSLTTLPDVQAVLDAALAIVRAERSKGGT